MPGATASRPDRLDAAAAVGDALDLLAPPGQIGLRPPKHRCIRRPRHPLRGKRRKAAMIAAGARRAGTGSCKPGEEPLAAPFSRQYWSGFMALFPGPLPRTSQSVAPSLGRWWKTSQPHLADAFEDTAALYGQADFQPMRPGRAWTSGAPRASGSRPVDLGNPSAPPSWPTSGSRCRPR